MTVQAPLQWEPRSYTIRYNAYARISNYPGMVIYTTKGVDEMPLAIQVMHDPPYLLGNCGTFEYKDLMAVNIKASTDIGICTFSRFGPMPFPNFLSAPNIVECQNAIIKQWIDYIIQNGYISQKLIAFGGRVNITEAQYTGCFGIYCGSIAKYIKDNKIGAITMSHLHVNSVHSSAKNDFSVQQVFLWSPPNQVVLKGVKNYTGSFGSTPAPIQFSYPKKWKRLVPTYRLPAATAIDNSKETVVYSRVRRGSHQANINK